MSSYTLTGSGTQALSADVTAAHITINTPSASAGTGRANPAGLYDVALLRFGDGTGYWSPINVVGGPQWVPVPAGASIVGFNVFGAVSLTFVEVIGGSPPFGTPTPSLEQLTDVTVSAISDGQLISWSASAGKWLNVTPTSAPQEISKIGEVNVGAGGSSTIAFSSIPSTYRALWLAGQVRSSAGATQDSLLMRLGTGGSVDAGLNYDSARETMNGAGLVSGVESLGGSSLLLGLIVADTAGAGRAGALHIEIPDYARTAWDKSTLGTVTCPRGSSSGDLITSQHVGLWRNTGVISNIELRLTTGSFKQNSLVELLGVG